MIDHTEQVLRSKICRTLSFCYAYPTIIAEFKCDRFDVFNNRNIDKLLIPLLGACPP